MAIQILIVDDHSVVRQGLRMFLAMDSELEIIGEAATGKEAISMVEDLKPDVVLMDLVMPEMDGVTATEIIRKHSVLIASHTNLIRPKLHQHSTNKQI